MICQFALRLVVGAALQWALLPRAKITSGFFRVQSLVALGILVLAALTSTSLVATASSGASPLLPAGWVWMPCALLAGVAYVSAVLWMLERRGAGTVCNFVVLLGTWCVLVAGRFSLSELATETGWFAVACETASAAVVGGSVTAMLLGHQYLTAAGMSLVPLERSNTLLGVTLGVRAVLSAVAVAVAWGAVGSQSQILWLSLRWLAGIVGPVCGVLMVQRILLLRNTQSATGVLFAAVVLVFIGELSASLLELELSMPF